MAIELPESGVPSLPQVPERLKSSDKELYEFLQAQKKELERLTLGLFNNANVIVNAANSGTSGTFTISSGGSIIITSGIVITVTS